MTYQAETKSKLYPPNINEWPNRWILYCLPNKCCVKAHCMRGSLPLGRSISFVGGGNYITLDWRRIGSGCVCLAGNNASLAIWSAIQKGVFVSYKVLSSWGEVIIPMKNNHERISHMHACDQRLRHTCCMCIIVSQFSLRGTPSLIKRHGHVCDQRLSEFLCTFSDGSLTRSRVVSLTGVWRYIRKV